MHIAIIEKDHFEVAYTLISLFDNGKNKITVFCEKESYVQLQFFLQEKITRYTWVLKKENESNRHFISYMFRRIHQDSFDLLYFNTIADNFILYAHYLRQLPGIRTVLTLHSINDFFDYAPSFSLRRLVRYIGKRKLINITPAFNVLSETLVAHLRPKLPSSKKTINIPGAFFDPPYYSSLSYRQGDTLKLVVPGSIDARRRNYKSVFDLLNKAAEMNIPLSITLLGSFSKTHGGMIRKRCLDYLQTNTNLHIYDSSAVPQDEFDRVINQSHFILMPLRPVIYSADAVEEKYGISICSGGIGDSIRHARPFFIPSGIPIERSLEQSCTFYQTCDDILKLLQELDPGHYKRLQGSAFQDALHYTKDAIIARNAFLFE